MCGVNITLSTNLVVDHCHRTGLERGFLCRSCNGREASGQGIHWDQYRHRPPSAICGQIDLYCDPWHGLVEPEEWVVQVLGPLPATCEARVAYLRAALKLDRRQLEPQLSPDQLKIFLGITL